MSNDKVFSGVVIEEESCFTLEDLCRACAVKTETITMLVEEGVIEPAAVDNEQWQFTGISLQRVRRAVRLQQDLGVNPPGAALALDLLDEITSLRARLLALDKDIPER